MTAFTRRVLLTANTAWNIRNYRMPLVHALLQDGAEVLVLAPEDDSSAILRAEGCKVYDLPMDARGTTWRDARLIARLRQEFARLRPDIILSYTIKNNIYGGLAARSLGIPILPNVTGRGAAFQASPLVQAIARQLYRQAFRGASEVFFQNAEDLSLFRDLGLILAQQGYLLKGSGIDLTEFAPVPLPGRVDAPVFLMIARLLPEKGVREFVEAARQVRQLHPLAQFRVLGPYQIRKSAGISEADMANWVAEGVVDYLGTANDVRPAIADADVVVLPSYYPEGAPRCLIEAAAMGRPLITTDTPGCRDVVGSDGAGVLCAPRDVESLTAALLHLLRAGPDHRARMGRLARRRVEAEFDVSDVISAYRRAMVKALSRKAATLG